MNRKLLAAMAAVAVAVSAGAQTASTTNTTNTTKQTTAASTTQVSRQAVTLPAGTRVNVRVNESLSSAEAQQGDRFTGVVADDVTLENGQVVIPRGAEVDGRVISASPSGRLSDAGELALSISMIRSGGMMVNVSSDPYTVKGESHTKSNTTKIGGGAALGAIIGAVAGGGKGAAIGAGVGAGAGAGAAAATGKREAIVGNEAVLTFVTATETRVTSASAQTQVHASNETVQVETPVLRRRDGSPADPPPADSMPKNVSTDTYTLSLRDKRVLSNCLQENASSLPAGTLTKDANATPLTKGQTLPANMGRKVRSLPLACDRELPALPTNLERVVFGGQVLLLDADSKILDVYGVE